MCKQPDTIMAHFILEDAQTNETMRHSYEYYEKITTHDSSLSDCIFGIMAAKLGMEEKAFQYFRDSAHLDLLDRHKNTKHGIHTSNMGGNYMAIVYGFGGFRLKEMGIFFAPILPKGWRSYQFKVCYEDSRIVVIVKEDNCYFKLLHGSAKKIYVYDKVYLLEDEIIINRKTNEK